MCHVNALELEERNEGLRHHVDITCNVGCQGEYLRATQPVLTRWSTCLQAMSYYAEQFSEVKNVLNSLNAEDAVSIATAHECFAKSGIQENIQYIHNRFSKIPEILKQLEARNNSLEHSLYLIDEISHRKLPSICSYWVEGKTPGKTQPGNLPRPGIEPDHLISRLDVLTVTPQSGASPNIAKLCIADNRRKFSFETLRMYVVVHCNSSNSILEDKAGK
ncbi:hypothetical protein ANN_26021 [Periplaneta americana]|uniref:Uncharacterized protein n=1 Tax=Periplaneta americana TaxID=6978 RepID=A0ABQ8S551_PERAM|nr:hypothetical protein ANN_26021 [Periplaneta americana]